MHKLPKVQFVSRFAVETLLKIGCETDGTRIICSYRVGGNTTGRLIVYIKDGLLVDPQGIQGQVKTLKKRFIKIITLNKTFQFPVYSKEFKG